MLFPILRYIFYRNVYIRCIHSWVLGTFLEGLKIKRFDIEATDRNETKKFWFVSGKKSKADRFGLV